MFLLSLALLSPLSGITPVPVPAVGGVLDIAYIPVPDVGINYCIPGALSPDVAGVPFFMLTSQLLLATLL